MDVDALFKKRKLEDDQEPGPSTKREKELSLLEYIEANTPQMMAFDAIDTNSLKKMILKFEKAVSKNQEMRAKFANDPQRFLQSEVDLDNAIKQLMIITVNPILLVHLVQLETLPSILSLLLHENTDIAISVIDLINELTDEDALNETDEKAVLFFVDDLIKNQLLELLMQVLEKLDESNPDDRQGVFKMFSKIIYKCLIQAFLKISQELNLKWSILSSNEHL
jgi:beta-catenin-like protein 1